MATKYSVCGCFLDKPTIEILNDIIQLVCRKTHTVRYFKIFKLGKEGSPAALKNLSKLGNTLNYLTVSFLMQSALFMTTEVNEKNLVHITRCGEYILHFYFIFYIFILFRRKNQCVQGNQRINPFATTCP